MRTKAHNVFGMSLAGTVGLVLFVSGCVTYDTLDVRMQIPPDPAAGQAVAIVRVTDRREFTRRLRQKKEDLSTLSTPYLPSVDFTNTVIRARAISWLPSATRFYEYSDYLLPEGRTVADVVREALTRAFRETGYRVVEPAIATQAKATPIEVDIDQFWCGRQRINKFSCAMPFDCIVKITGNITPFKNGETVAGHVALHTESAGSRRPAMNTINAGLEAFVKEVKQRLTTTAPTDKKTQAIIDAL